VRGQEGASVLEHEEGRGEGETHFELNIQPEGYN